MVTRAERYVINVTRNFTLIPTMVDAIHAWKAVVHVSSIRSQKSNNALIAIEVNS